MATKVEMIRLLELISKHGCHNSTEGIGSCYKDGRVEDNPSGTWNSVCDACLAHKALQGTRRPRPAPAPPPPAEVYVMGWHGSTAVGSFTHVSSGDPFHLTEEACQKSIDEMRSWIGMGDRARYRPLKLMWSGVAQ